MTELIRLALKNGAAGVVAVPVADDEGYEAGICRPGGDGRYRSGHL